MECVSTEEMVESLMKEILDGDLFNEQCNNSEADLVEPIETEDFDLIGDMTATVETQASDSRADMVDDALNESDQEEEDYDANPSSDENSMGLISLCN